MNKISSVVSRINWILISRVFALFITSNKMVSLFPLAFSYAQVIYLPLWMTHRQHKGANWYTVQGERYWKKVSGRHFGLEPVTLCASSTYTSSTLYWANRIMFVEWKNCPTLWRKRTPFICLARKHNLKHTRKIFHRQNNFWRFWYALNPLSN